MRGVGFEPTRISPTDLKPVTLTTRTSPLKGDVTLLFLRTTRTSPNSCYLACLGGGSGLHVVAVEEALEVEVRQLLALRKLEELLQRGVGLDGVLVLQLVLVHVHIHRLRHLGAAHQGATGLAEEGAQLIRHLHGALEDGRRTGLGALGTLLRLDPAAALAGLLQVAVHTLLQALHHAQQLSHVVAHGHHAGEGSL